MQRKKKIALPTKMQKKIRIRKKPRRH